MASNYSLPKNPSRNYPRNFKKIAQTPDNFSIPKVEPIEYTIFENPTLMDIDPTLWSWYIEYYSYILGCRCYWYNHPHGYTSFMIVGRLSATKRLQKIMAWHIQSAHLYYTYYFEKVERCKTKARKRLRDNPKAQNTVYQYEKPRQYASEKLKHTNKNIRLFLISQLEYIFPMDRTGIDLHLRRIKFNVKYDPIQFRIEEYYSPPKKFKFKTLCNGKFRKTLQRLKSRKGTARDLGTGVPWDE